MCEHNQPQSQSQCPVCGVSMTRIVHDAMARETEYRHEQDSEECTFEQRKQEVKRELAY